MLSSVNSDFDRICAAVLHKYDRLILHMIIPTKGGESCRDFSAFKGSCKLNNYLRLLSSFLSFIFALNFLHKVFHSSGHGGPVLNKEKYYPPLGDEGEVEDEVVPDPAHVPGSRHDSNVRLVIHPTAHQSANNVGAFYKEMVAVGTLSKYYMLGNIEIRYKP